MVPCKRGGDLLFFWVSSGVGLFTLVYIIESNAFYFRHINILLSVVIKGVTFSHTRLFFFVNCLSVLNITEIFDVKQQSINDKYTIWLIIRIVGFSTQVTPRYSWNIAKVGVKHQSINQSTQIFFSSAFLNSSNIVICYI